MMHFLIRALPLLLLAMAARADDPRFSVIRIDPARDRLQLFLKDEAGLPFRRLDRLANWLQQQGRPLVFAMNAGMYHHDLAPVGLLVMDGTQVAPLNLEEGSGNFFLKPNGVFFVAESGAGIVAAEEYPAQAGPVRLATQSGPLLVRKGRIHPAFNPASTSRRIRNGVGTCAGAVVFVISEQAVTFHEFAVFFRDDLQCQDALYLDGVVSSLYAPELGRRDSTADLGPIIGLTR